MKVFYVNWGTGHAKVNVGNFFGIAKFPAINRLLSLAKIYCNEQQRLALISGLKEAKKERMEAVTKLGSVVWPEFAERFFSKNIYRNSNNCKKELNTQCERIEKCIKKIEAMTWGRTC